MLLDVIYSICFNICLLVVLAFMMTKMDFVQRLLLNEEGEDYTEKHLFPEPLPDALSSSFLTSALFI